MSISPRSSFEFTPPIYGANFLEDEHTTEGCNRSVNEEFFNVNDTDSCIQKGSLETMSFPILGSIVYKYYLLYSINHTFLFFNFMIEKHLK
ncbi:hypothetical protein AYI70_g7113 [Smittium culicis]|uniref:Uncharacterized protein n=1 Tax=Smittium culicis TaxID=133412 RepID=A0A1R1XLZ3_9FUNG|nr:hypothetical protein AYI70_g7113 [Smittium culicis]